MQHNIVKLIVLDSRDSPVVVHVWDDWDRNRTIATATLPNGRTARRSTTRFVRPDPGAVGRLLNRLPLD